MSGGGGDNPFDDPFGSNERTVIRPNPGGRRPGPGQPGAPGAPPGNPFGNPQQPPPGGLQPPQGMPQGYPQQPQQPPPHYPQQPPGGFQQPPQQPPQGNFQQPPPQPGYPPQGMPQQPQGFAPMGQGQEAPAVIAMPGDNPLLAAAGPLLNLLGRLRNGIAGVNIHQLKDSVARAIDSFETEAGARGAQRDQIPYAKYALAASADDIVQNLPIQDRHIWTADPMLSRYFGEREGGVRFFQNLDGLLRNPGDNYHVLELHYACLALGFEGMHRHSQQGQGALQTIRMNTHQALRGVKGGTGWDLSPRWQGKDLARQSVGMQVPVWAVGSVLVALLAGLFFTLRALLGSETEALAGDIAVIHPDTRVAVIYTDNATGDPVTPPPYVPPPPPDAGQLERIRTKLAPEIATGQIKADYLDANYIIVQLPNELLFDSGSADVSDAFLSGLAPRLGEMFREEEQILKERGFKMGHVKAVGHSDAEPLSATSRWKSNQELSQARAESVARAIYAHSPKDMAILVEGRGPDDPVCLPPTEPNCYAKNRRVELLIERTR